MMFGTRTKHNTTVKFQRTDFKAFHFWRAFFVFKEKGLPLPPKMSYMICLMVFPCDLGQKTLVCGSNEFEMKHQARKIMAQSLHRLGLFLFRFKKFPNGGLGNEPP